MVLLFSFTTPYRMAKDFRRIAKAQSEIVDSETLHLDEPLAEDLWVLNKEITEIQRLLDEKIAALEEDLLTSTSVPFLSSSPSQTVSEASETLSKTKRRLCPTPIVHMRVRSIPRSPQRSMGSLSSNSST